MEDRAWKEDLILEAICTDGYRTIDGISKHTGIKYNDVRTLINGAGLLSDLREMRRREDEQKAYDNYRQGITLKELKERVGVGGWRIRRETMEKAKKQLEHSRRRILHILSRRFANDAPACCAFHYSHNLT